MLYELDYKCSVEVIEIYPIDDEEREKRVCEGVNVYGNVGDRIEGDAIQMYVDIKRNNLRQKVKEGVSGRHGATLIHTTNRTFASVKYPLQNALSRLGLTASGKLIKKD